MLPFSYLYDIKGLVFLDCGSFSSLRATAVAYAPTITTIISRRYVAKEGKNLYITELGEIVNDMMKRAFPGIVNTEFTANVEGLLDYIADGSVKWKTVVRNFYPDL